MTVDKRAVSLFAFALLAILGVMLFVERVPQWPGYHDFADARLVAGIPFAANVFSNLVFLGIGAWGCGFVLTARGSDAAGDLRPAYLLFFAGVALTGVGSAWYHWHPDNASLVWDRWPMTIAFTALLSIVIGELISVRAGRVLLLPLLVAGLGSVGWWAATELAGQGDLRPYGLVQFLPLVLIALMAFLYEHPEGFSAVFLTMGALYVLAKACEYYDVEIFEWTGFVSGHTLKHLLAGAAAAGPLVMLHRRDG